MIVTSDNIQYDLDNKNVTILKPMTIYQIHNQMKHDFMHHTLIHYPFPMFMYGDCGQYEMQLGWTMIDTRNIM